MDEDSDHEIVSQDHKKLVDNILNLNSRQYINKPSRTEPTAQISEYNLIKSLGDDKDDVQLYSLTKSLQNRAVEVELRKKVKKAEVKSKTLAKPLEKPEAERIKRSTAYESTKNHLDRWEPVVTSNRVSTNLSFPLKNQNFDYKEGRDFSSNWVLKSNLEKELEKLEPKVETVEVETETHFPMTLKEMMAKRKEMAKLRRYQSYKEIKARKQNKIKSKKFRRIMRKEKSKEQMKEFELLQKTNPEEALKKLEEIEKARAEERASLRHKSTGKWARNQQIRAKYDKESRKVLSQQLAISKELSQKQETYESSESDDDNDNGDVNNGNMLNENSENIWFNEIKPSKEVEEFVSGYRKYWESQNIKKLEENVENDESAKEKGNNVIREMDDDNIRLNAEEPVSKNDENLIEPHGKSEIENNKQSKMKIPLNVKELISKNDEKLIEISGKGEIGKTKQNKMKIQSKVEDPVSKNDESLIKPGGKMKISNNKRSKMKKMANTYIKRKAKNERHLEIDGSSEVWEVMSINNENDTFIDNIFDNIEYSMKDRVDKKLKKIESKLKDNTKPAQKKRKLQHKKTDNVIKNDTNKVLARAEDNKSVQNVEVPQSNENFSERDSSSKTLESLKTIFEARNSSKTPNKANKINSDQEKYKNTKPIALNTALPDVLAFDDNEESMNTGGIIMEAFEDADIVEEFTKEKKEDIEKDRPKDIDLTLPGWGSWGGKDIPIPRKKRKRFILKAPRKVPRKDMNKGHLILNESANDKAKSHMVSEVPFPFKTVKDFEASLRAPIGNTFVPETAFRRNIKPTLMTRMGSIIEPITEDILLHKEKKKKSNVKSK